MMKKLIFTFKYSWVQVLCGAFVLVGSVWAQAGVRPVDAPHVGYVSSVEEEKDLRVVEMVLVREPRTYGPPLRQLIFDPKLEKEFAQRYEEKFGRTDADRNVDTPNQFAESGYVAGKSVLAQDEVDEQQIFAQFMVRRLTEFHVDNYVKSNPSVRPLYELKERVSKMSVKVKKGYKLNINYSYSGNFLDIKVDNPLEIRNKLKVEMDPEKMGPSEVKETIMSVEYPVDKQIVVGSDVHINAGYVSLYSRRALTPRLTTSISGSTYWQNAEDQESRLLLGITWR